MRMITLCLSKTLGGLELYACRSAVYAAKTESVLFITSPGSALSKRLENTDIKMKFLTPGFTQFPLVNAFRLARLIDESNADLIHMHWGKDLPLASLAIKLSTRKPALIYTRQMQITRKKTDLFHQFIYKEMSQMLAITEQLKQRCAAMLGNTVGRRVRTLYYGVPEPDHLLSTQEISDGRQALQLMPADFVIGLFGRLEDQKGQHLLIRAMAKARQEGIALRAIIVGHEMNPGYVDTLRQLASELNIADSIRFMDFVDEPQKLMQLCDCVLLATYMETFGLVLPEAMRAGVAVIGSNAGGVPEIIEHGKTGLLFKPRDINDLKTQLLVLYRDRDKRLELAQAGKNKADLVFNDGLHFRQLLEIFHHYAKPENRFA